MCIDEYKLLLAQNKALKEQCASLQQEIQQYKTFTDAEVIEIIQAYAKERKENQELYKFIEFLRSKL